MNHWAEKWIGMPWTREWDCACLVRDVLKKDFDIELNLPAGLDWKKMSQAEVKIISEDFAIPSIYPKEGDGVLMKIMGRRRDLGSHIGVYSVVDSVPWVLHNVESIGVLFTPISQLKLLSLQNTGFYTWT